MSGFVEEFDNDQALLLMYLAGELTAQDKALVERKLADDPSLREELTQLQSAHSAFMSAMQKLDAHEALPVPESVAIDRVGRIIRQWTTERLARPRRTVARPKFNLPGWVYPVAAAVVAFIVFISLDTIRQNGPTPQPGIPQPDPIAQLSDQQQQDLIDAVSNESASSSLDDADNAVAGLQGADSILNPDDRQETR